jgi:hypothetical protein
MSSLHEMKELDPDSPSASVERETSHPATARLAIPSLTAAVIQAICVFSMAANTVKVALGIGSAAAAGGASFVHSDPVRIPLMIVAAMGATVTQYVVWKGWRLRNLPSARWRKRPLSSAERWRIGAALASSILSWLLVICEILAHRALHP